MELAKSDHLRDQLIEAIHFHAGAHGWNKFSLIKAAEDLEIPAREALRVFPDGSARDMIAHMHDLGDRRLKEALEKQDMSAMRVRDKVALGVRLRLEPWRDARNGFKRAIPTLLAPHHSAMTTKMIYQTVDIIWRAAGDVSVDSNFYTKRGLLGGVYLSTLLYWLNDPSKYEEESWHFLDRRIGQALSFGQKSGQVKKNIYDRAGPVFAGMFRASPSDFIFQTAKKLSNIIPRPFTASKI